MAHSDIEDVLPATPPQESLYLEWLYRGGEEGSYVLQDTMEFRGPFDADRMRAAVATVLARYPALRAGFHMRPGTGRLVQVILREAEIPLESVDLRDEEPSRREDEIRSILSAELCRQTDLAKPPLIRGLLISVTPERHVLALTYHHILLDGWSGYLLLEQIIDGYDGTQTTRDLPGSYRAYGTWLAGQNREPAEVAWRSYLSGLRTGTRVAFDGAGNRASVARRLERRLDPRTTERLRACARDHDLTLNTVVQAAWGLVMSHLCDSSDIVIGKTVAGRPADLPGSDRMIGMFANTIPARIRLDGAETVGQLCLRIQSEQARLADHEYLGLSAIQEACGRRSLFDTGFVFQNVPGLVRRPQTREDGLRVTFGGHNTPHFPMVLTAFLDEDTLVTRLGYAGGMFPESAMVKAADALQLLLARIIDATGVRIAELGTLSVEALSPPVDEPAKTGPGGAAEATAEEPAAEGVVMGTLMGLLSEIFGVAESDIDPRNDFFELGGGSLQAARLAIRLQQLLGAEVSVRQILDHPVIGDLARVCAETVAAEPSRKR
ncbi:condensation domain-containing protein [Streptomyces sp. NPDC017248]|uniref:condensation domain-containing protein n=1 Tax=unclassified Streptomyces TaxID=2593676 RepID=UPI0037AD2F08